jgi:putative redox protein
MQDLIVTFPGGKKVDARLGEFMIHTDQPKSVGGEGTAPSPLSYCLASLGACAGYYVLAYLQARDLPTQGLKLIQKHETDSKKGHVVKIRMILQVPAGVSEEHVGPMIRSAEKCAVKNLIEKRPEIEIVTGVVDESSPNTPE